MEVANHENKSSIDIQETSSYLEVRLSGEFDLGEQLDNLLIIVQAIKDVGQPKVLIDARNLTGHPNAIERFRYASTFAELLNDTPLLAEELSTHIAFLGIRPLVDPMKFGETVAVNRGASGIVTESKKEALDWLRQW